MSGADGEDVFESEFGKFARQVLMFRMVDLVDDEQHWFAHFAENARQFVVKRIQPFLCVDEKQNERALRNGSLGSSANVGAQLCFARANHPAGVP